VGKRSRTCEPAGVTGTRTRGHWRQTQPTAPAREPVRAGTPRWRVPMRRWYWPITAAWRSCRAAAPATSQHLTGRDRPGDRPGHTFKIGRGGPPGPQIHRTGSGPWRRPSTWAASPGSARAMITPAGTQSMRLSAVHARLARSAGDTRLGSASTWTRETLRSNGGLWRPPCSGPAFRPARWAHVRGAHRCRSGPDRAGPAVSHSTRAP
jgi:hypothetical protein